MERNSAETHTEGRLSLFLQEQRIKAALPYTSSGSVLDFGCGNGELAKHIGRDRYIGIDINPKAILIARTRFPSHEFIVSDGYSFKDNSQDKIALLAVIEHLTDPESHLNYFRKVLRPGGKLIITTPNPVLRRAHELGADIGMFSKNSAEEHKSMFTIRDIQQMGDDLGYVVERADHFLGFANQIVVFRN